MKNLKKKPVVLITGYLEKIETREPFDFEQIDSSSAIQKAINSLNGTKGCTDEYGITSLVYEEKRPFNRERFTDFVNEKCLDEKAIA